MTNKQAAAVETLDDAQIVHYLRTDPSFFERNPELLSSIKLPSPHGEGVISLTEKQLHSLREKLNQTEVRINQMMAYGKENETINHNIHTLSLQLLQVNDMDACLALLDAQIKTPFGLTHASLHLFNDQKPLPEAFTTWASKLTTPYCSSTNSAIQTLVNAQVINDKLLSFGVIPLTSATSNTVMGVILLGHEDANHFTQDMGTVFLARIGELFSARLTSLST